ncbi:MAG: transposase [Caldilineaceae bacterium]|nr:transposase [Caldilineaceae bacterium]
MERQPYDTDLSERIRPLRPGPCPCGRPIAVPRREIVNAILYVLWAGCAWRWLPHDLPCWTLVYWYFRTWRARGLWGVHQYRAARAAAPGRGPGDLAQRGHRRQSVRENDGNPGSGGDMTPARRSRAASAIWSWTRWWSRMRPTSRTGTALALARRHPHAPAHLHGHQGVDGGRGDRLRTGQGTADTFRLSCAKSLVLQW